MTDEIDDHGNETERYPFETAHLKKGDVVTADVIARGYSVKVDTDEYRLVVLKASEFLVQSFEDRVPPEYVVTKCDGDDIRILTDAEAVPYTTRQINQGVRKIRNNYKRQTRIDRGQLNQAQCDEHATQLAASGRLVSSINKARRPPPALQPYVRQTPGLVARTKKRKKSDPEG